MKTQLEIREELRAPFKSADIEWRVGTKYNGKGTMLPYVSARAIMARLDSVFGEDGWTPEYQVTTQGIICTLSCRYVDENEQSRLIVKSDGAEYTEKASPLKGGISGALKRAASCLGVGRYLYDLPLVKVNLTNDKFYGKVILPDAFLPKEEHTGNDTVKVEYSSYSGSDSYKKSEPENDKPMTDEVREAMEFVVKGDQYNDGKKLGDIRSTKSLYFISKNNSDPMCRANAAIVLEYRGGNN